MNGGTEEVVVPRTQSPEPYEPEDYNRSVSNTSTTTATARATGSVSRIGTTGRRVTNTSIPVEASTPVVPAVSVQPASALPTPLPRHWHPKLTPYRLLVILTTLGFGLSKAILSYQGRSIAPITLEWFFGTGVFLLFFALDTYQGSTSTPILPWFFEVDINYVLWKRICTLFGVKNPPFYATEEQTRRQSLIESTHPPIRGYDLLVTLSTAIVGMAKSILAYRGQDTAMNSVDWVGAVVVGIGLYWLGLYQSNPIGLMPYLFVTDYSGDLKEDFLSPSTPFRILPQLAVMALAGWWSYKCVGWTKFLANLLPEAEEPKQVMLERVLYRLLFPCLTATYITVGMAGVGLGVWVALLFPLSRFRPGRLSESAFLLWHFTGFFFRICLYMFFMPTIAGSIAMMVPLAPVLFSIAKENPWLWLSMTLVLGGTLIMCAILWWFCKLFLGEFRGVARVLGRPLLRRYAEWLRRTRRTGSLGV